MFRQTKEFKIVFKHQEVEATAGPVLLLAMLLKCECNIQKGQVEQGQFFFSFPATPSQRRRVGAEQVHPQSWTALGRTV